jgi:hypothetical protein
MAFLVVMITVAVCSFEENQVTSPHNINTQHPH